MKTNREVDDAQNHMAAMEVLVHDTKARLNEELEKVGGVTLGRIASSSVI